MDRAVNYRRALLREFRPALRGRVLEVGAGVGQLSAMLDAVADIEQVVSVEPDPRFCATIRRALPAHALVEGTIDDVGPDGGWDALVSVNVLEHVREDDAELAKYRERLRERQGRLCLFVPARPELYGPIDADFGHFRRYGRRALRGQLERAGFEIERLHYFNWVGYLAWWWNFRLWRRRRFDAGSVARFDRFVFPAMHALESRVVRPPFGQSLLAMARPRT